MHAGKLSLSRLPVKQSTLEVPGVDRRESRLTMRPRASSTSRMSALSTVETPAFRRSKSSQSLRPTPQSALHPGTGSATRYRSTERAKHKTKDARPLQDKKWQQHQLTKVQAYFQQLPGGCAKLHKATSIRPMTLAMFVDLCNTLVHNIDPRLAELTLANYTELLPSHLGLLLYPGVVNKSMLKTANTMHSWPHVLGLLSWLVELHLLEDAAIEQALFQTPDDAPLLYRIEKFKWRIAMDSFVAWNTQQSELDVAGTFERGLKSMYAVHEGQAAALRAERDEKQLYLADLQAKVQRTQRSAEAGQQRLTAVRQDMLRDRENHAQQLVYSRNVRETVATRTANIHKLKHAIEQERQSKTVLTERIGQQPMSRRQRDDKLVLIEDLRAKLALRKQTRTQQLQICDAKDLQMSQHKRQLEQKINAYNNSLMEPALRYPALSEFLLPENGFMRPDAHQVVAEKALRKDALALCLAQQNDQLDRDLSQLRDTLANLQLEVDEAVAVSDKRTQAIEEVQTRLAALKETAQDRERAAQSRMQDLQEAIAQTDHHELLPRLNTLREKCQWWQCTIEAEQEMGLATFTAMQNDVDKYVATLRACRQKLDEAVPRCE